MYTSNSSFSLDKQNQDVDSRIVVALERISAAFRVLLWKESKESSLSPIQIQLLIFLLFHSADKCRVSYLAHEFNMTKATISDSVKGLLSKGLVMKQPNAADSRSYTLLLTDAGRAVAHKVSTFSGIMEQPLMQLTPAEKEVMLNGLLKVIYNLHKAGIITVQRMCFSCSYYRAEAGIHYCQLLRKSLYDNEIRMDCPEHQSAVALTPLS